MKNDRASIKIFEIKSKLPAAELCSSKKILQIESPIKASDAKQIDNDIIYINL